jgi:hypothetical protein
MLGLLLRHSLNNNNGGNNTNLSPSIDLLLARQKLLLSGRSGRNASSQLAQASLSTLANAAQGFQPALTRTDSSRSSSSNATSVSEAIRKRTSGGISASSAEEEPVANKRRRIVRQSEGWTPSCTSSSKDATFRLPNPSGDGEKNPFQEHSLKDFRSKWADLDKKAASLKSVKTKAEKAEFMREMFARSLREGIVVPSGLKKKSAKKYNY